MSVAALVGFGAAAAGLWRCELGCGASEGCDDGGPGAELMKDEKIHTRTSLMKL